MQMYALPYHAMLAMLPNSVVILGMAVEMIVPSRAAMKTQRIRPAVIMAKRKPCGYCGAGESSWVAGVASSEGRESFSVVSSMGSATEPCDTDLIIVSFKMPCRCHGEEPVVLSIL
jgi:hypothetical protein